MNNECTISSHASLVYFLHPSMGAKYCDQHVCFYVCLSVCLLEYLRNHTSKFHQIFYTCSSSDSNMIHYVLLVLWMMSCFHIMHGIGQSQRLLVCFSSSPRGGAGAKSSVSDCSLLLHCFCLCSS